MEEKGCRYGDYVLIKKIEGVGGGDLIKPKNFRDFPGHWDFKCQRLVFYKILFKVRLFKRDDFRWSPPPPAQLLSSKDHLYRLC